LSSNNKPLPVFSATKSPLKMDTRRRSIKSEMDGENALLEELADSSLALTENSLEKLLQELDEEDIKTGCGTVGDGSLKRSNNDSANIVKNLNPKKSRLSQSEKAAKPTLDEMLSSSIKTEPSSEYMDICVICGKRLVERSGSVNQPNLRFHYAQEHYFPAGSFAKIAPPAEPVEKGELLPRDIMGHTYKYTCPYHCTRRRMGYKEHVLHLATQHHKLKEVMKVDTRPGIEAVLGYLYPEERLEMDAVKKEKVENNATLETEDNSEDVDDPSWELPQQEVKKGGMIRVGRNVSNSPQYQVAKTTKELSIPIVDKIHACVFCDSKDGKNLNLGSGLQDLRYHYSVCYYSKGRFFNVVDPGLENTDSQGKVIDEFGRKFRYKCPIQNCHKNQGRGKTNGYKELCIHTGVAHHMVELLISREEDPLPDLEEVRKALEMAREKEGVKLAPFPPVSMEEIHTCVLCKGKDKDGLNLSFAGYKMCQTRYHYASCFYDSGVYLEMYSPGKANRDEDGKVIDIMGRRVKYTCNEKCSLKREMGYKELCIHMSNEHGGLEAVMSNDPRPEIQEILEKIKKKE